MARKSRKVIPMEAPATSSVYIRTAMYIRLSVEDNHNRGNSLDNQKLIIQDYLADKPEFEIVDTYIDNGLSGMNFDRPDFRRLLADIEAGRIDSVIVKDLSRLGRNFIDTSYYIEQYFVAHAIRFIAVTDHFDTTLEDGQHGGIMLPLKNMINEAYALDIGRKIKAQAHQAMLNGEFVGARAPYGYKKDPDNCHRLVVDEAAAAVVRQIFQWAYKQVGLLPIVKRLNEAGILPPAAYRKQHGDAGKNYVTGSRKWQTCTINMILRNRTYTGDMAQGKSRRVDHRQLLNDPENYIIVPNTHPALVSHEIFDAVQAYRQEVRETCAVKENQPYTPNIYKGKVFCAHCGRSLHRQRSNRKKGPDVYVIHCLTNSRVNKKDCAGVMITEAELSQTVMEILTRDLSAELVNQVSLSRMENEREKEQARINKALAEKRRTLDNSRKMQRTLYEDHIKGILPDADYESLRSEAQALHDRLESEIYTLESEQSAMHKQADKQRRMEEGAAELKETNLLTAELLDKLVSRIEVSHSHEVSISFLFRDAFGKVAGK